MPNHPAPGHDEVLRTAIRMVENGEVQPSTDPLKRQAINPASLIANLQKYGPTLLADLMPLAGGANAATVAAVLVNLVHTFVATPAA